MYCVVTEEDSEFHISGKTLMYENTCVSACSILYTMEFHENTSKRKLRRYFLLKVKCASLLTDRDVRHGVS